MTRSQKTRKALLQAARKLFWNKGYSNVSVRDISRAAGVDAALVSRYFGGKTGLFEASLQGAFDWPELRAAGAGFLDVILQKSAQGVHEAEDASAMKMLILNASDPEVGPVVRREVEACFSTPVAEMLGGENPAERVAMIMAALIGCSIVRYDIQARGMAKPDTEAYGRQLRHLVTAAMNYEGSNQPE